MMREDPRLKHEAGCKVFQGLPCRVKIAKDRQDGGGKSKVHAISCVSNMCI